MNRSALRLLTVILGTGLVVVPFMGLDKLPHDLRTQIDSERRALTSAASQVRAANDEVAGELRSNADVFRTVPASREWPGTISAAGGVLQNANRDMDELSKLEKANRRADRQRVEGLLREERGLRASAVAQATGAQKDAAHWVALKQQLPDELRQMQSDYNAVHGFDLDRVAAAVQSAENDWPEKQTDLDSRLASLRSMETQADAVWQSSAAARSAAAANDFSRLDFGGLVNAADSLKNTAAALPQKAEELKTLSGQLYNSWDKILVDMEERGKGDSKRYEQEIRTINTRLQDASAKTGTTTSDEQWVNVSPATYKAEQNDLGMAIEHKSAGKYDLEAEHTPQPAGFAYVAPPTQPSNQYGYWDHRDGRDFWVFYGQYALMRDLLFNHNYQPLGRYEWEDYHTYQRTGRTYYGRDEAAGQAPKYGSQGTATQSRYAGSTYARSGGFRDSKYASKPGGYRDSRFASPSASDPNADHSPRKFGSGNRPPEPHAAPPSRFRPAPSPRPSFRPPSVGRRFGRH